MPISIQCPSCKKGATVPDSAAGKTIRCKCGTSFPVPEILNLADVEIHPGQIADDLSLQSTSHDQDTSVRSPHPSGPSPKQLHASHQTARHSGQAKRSQSNSKDATYPLRKPQPEKMPQTSRNILVGCLGFLGIGVLCFIWLVRDIDRAAKKAAPAIAASAAEEKRLALDEVIHQFERTDASVHCNRDDFRSIIYVVFKTVPENRRVEAMSDLLTVARIDPYSFKTLKEHSGSGGGPNWSSLSLAVMGTFHNLYEQYHGIREDCKRRGTTIEVEAAKVLINGKPDMPNTATKIAESTTKSPVAPKTPKVIPEVNKPTVVKPEPAIEKKSDKQLAAEFCVACWRGPFESVETKLKNDPQLILAKMDMDETCLMRAVQGRQKKIIELLVKNRADVNAKTRDIAGGWTALHFSTSDDYETTELLLNSGASVNAKTSETKETPLHFAARGDKTGRIVELLISKGANVNAIDFDGHTPLWWAIKGKHKESVRILREHGAKE